MSTEVLPLMVDADVRTRVQDESSTKGWSPEFFDRLKQADAETLAAIDEMVEVVRRKRRLEGADPMANEQVMACT